MSLESPNSAVVSLYHLFKLQVNEPQKKTNYYKPFSKAKFFLSQDEWEKMDLLVFTFCDFQPSNQFIFVLS